MIENYLSQPCCLGSEFVLGSPSCFVYVWVRRCWVICDGDSWCLIWNWWRFGDWSAADLLVVRFIVRCGGSDDLMLFTCLVLLLYCGFAAVSLCVCDSDCCGLMVLRLCRVCCWLLVVVLSPRLLLLCLCVVCVQVEIVVWFQINWRRESDCWFCSVKVIGVMTGNWCESFVTNWFWRLWIVCFFVAFVRELLAGHCVGFGRWFVH